MLDFPGSAVRSEDERSADRLRGTDSAASIALYQRLLKDYRDAVIRLQVRNRVEGRARQADDQ